MFHSGSKSQICFANILCSMTEQRNKKELSTPSPSSQGKELKDRRLIRAGYRATCISSHTNPSHITYMGGWPRYIHTNDHCAQEVTVKLNYISPVPIQAKSSCSDHLALVTATYPFPESWVCFQVVSLSIHLPKHFTNWVVILEQMHITQVNPFSLIKDTWPSDSRALVGSLLTTKLGCLDEWTQEHVPKKRKNNNRGCVCEAFTLLRAERGGGTSLQKHGWEDLFHLDTKKAGTGDAMTELCWPSLPLHHPLIQVLSAQLAPQSNGTE